MEPFSLVSIQQVTQLVHPMLKNHLKYETPHIKYEMPTPSPLQNLIHL